MKKYEIKFVRKEIYIETRIVEAESRQDAARIGEEILKKYIIFDGEIMGSDKWVETVKEVSKA
jgi:hypothetical protein